MGPRSLRSRIRGDAASVQFAFVEAATLLFGFSELIAAGTPVAVLGSILYTFVQRWLCDPDSERGLHWRGLVLKLACWPTFFAGTLLAIGRAEIPYIPTAKEAVKGRFLRLAWPSLLLVCIYAATLLRVLYLRMFRTSEASLELSSEAVWGMLAFATLPVLSALGAIYAAWQARTPPRGVPWESVDVSAIGGTAA
jgi:cellulose synthase (UDP-forming)